MKSTNEKEIVSEICYYVERFPPTLCPTCLKVYCSSDAWHFSICSCCDGIIIFLQDFGKLLEASAVAYLNVDVAVGGES